MRNRATTPLSKSKLRQSWSKFNLFNLSRTNVPPYRPKTVYQQKWTAKSVLRDYHGEQVRESQWTRMFQKKLRSVVPMDPAYLAMNDGSFESAGRGSGLQGKELITEDKTSIPYMLMTFAPLERRLDTAIFRAMFASSARQARQFVVHGGVKVNGKTMRYPGYLLNPGDMFQVEPDRVMFATGAPKAASETKTAEAGQENATEVTAEEESVVETEQEDEIDIEREPREVLKDLLSQSKSILAAPSEKIGAKKKQDLRAFSSAVKRMLSRSSSSAIVTESLEAQFKEIQNQLKISRQNRQQGKGSHPSQQDGQETTQSQVSPEADEFNDISDAEYNQLFAALSQSQENPIDENKPYATPWVPRDYMSAFAHIPRYLEVNQNVCAAVYLRHPVARPGIGEVPTPFPEAVNGTAFTWYLRRR